MHVDRADPDGPYCPAGHASCALPPGQYTPPLALQAEHTDEPLVLVVPPGHGEQLDEPSLLNQPTAHAPLHSGHVIPDAFPNRPATHGVQKLAFALELYVPAGHTLGSGDVHPTPQ